MPASPATAGPQLQIAVFIDFENIALGLRDASAPFEVRRVLDRLLEKGKSELLEDAQESGIVTLRKDERSGTYVVTGVASERPRRRRSPRG